LIAVLFSCSMAIGTENISCFRHYDSCNLWLWCSETENC